MGSFTCIGCDSRFKNLRGLSISQKYLISLVNISAGKLNDQLEKKILILMWHFSNCKVYKMSCFCVWWVKMCLRQTWNMQLECFNGILHDFLALKEMYNINREKPVFFPFTTPLHRNVNQIKYVTFQYIAVSKLELWIPLELTMYKHNQNLCTRQAWH